MKKVLIFIMAALFLSVGFSQNDKIESTYEKQGNLVAVTNYYEDGSIKEKGFYKDKKLHGEWKMYNQEGVLIVKAYYENGKKTGKWLFLKDGVLTEVDYSNNKVSQVHEWNSKKSIAAK